VSLFRFFVAVPGFLVGTANVYYILGIWFIKVFVCFCFCCLFCFLFLFLLLFLWVVFLVFYFVEGLFCPIYECWFWFLCSFFKFHLGVFSIWPSDPRYFGFLDFLGGDRLIFVDLYSCRLGLMITSWTVNHQEKVTY